MGLSADAVAESTVRRDTACKSGACRGAGCVQRAA